MESRRREERNAEDDAVRRGWCLGSEGFRRELLEAAQERVGGSHYGGERQAGGEGKAQRRVRGELDRRGPKEEDLTVLPKGDKRKVALARRLRQETTMSLKWIAQRLHMGSWTYVSTCCMKNKNNEFVSIVRIDTGTGEAATSEAWAN